MFLLDEALDSIALSGRSLCNRSCDISAMLARQQPSPCIQKVFSSQSEGGENLNASKDRGEEGGSTLLLLAVLHMSAQSILRE